MTTGIKQRLRRLSVAGVVLAAACGSGPPPKLYLLEPVHDSESVVSHDTDGASNELSVPGLLGMSTVKLPGYAADEQIASLQTDGTVFQHDRHRWAEEPVEAITRVLADRLRTHSGGTVLIEPWPRDYDPAARIEVVFDRLLREPLGGVDMSGQIHLLSGDGRVLLKALPFQIIHYGRDTNQRVFFVAVSRAIDDIARMALKSLARIKLSS